MAKKKKNNQQQTKLSPERYIREKARKLPVDKCMIPETLFDDGMGTVIVTRKRPDGKYVVGQYLVDTYCMGVKDAVCYADMTEAELTKILERYEEKWPYKEVTYNEAHNIIYGAIEFADEAGVPPHRDFKLAQYVLEPDTEDIPIIEYDFGLNGKHCYMPTNERDYQYGPIIAKNLGSDFIKADEEDVEEDFDDEDFDDEDFDDEEGPDFEGMFSASPDIPLNDKQRETLDLFKTMLTNMNDMYAEMNRLPKEKYSYAYPEYPGVLSIKNSFIVPEIYERHKDFELPKEFINKLADLDPEELSKDLGDIILFEIGRTYPLINDGTIDDEDNQNDAIINSLKILCTIGLEEAFPAVAELVCQNDEFMDYHLGDYAPNYIPGALATTSGMDPAKLEKLLYTPGIGWYARDIIAHALCMVAIVGNKRTEVIEVFRRFLQYMLPRVAEADNCDGTLAGMLVCRVQDLQAEELIPEVKALYDAGLVDKTATGDFDGFMKEFKSSPINLDKYYIEIVDGLMSD